MSQDQRPQSLRLRQIARSHGPDIGNLHVIDYWLHRATIDTINWHRKFIAPRIGRYLDGEEETEGTYR